MENKLKKTLIATAVSAILSITVFAAPQATPNQVLPAYDHNATLANQPIKTSAIKKPLPAVAKTKAQYLKSTGYQSKVNKDHVDNQFNVATFTWAKSSKKNAKSLSAVPLNVLSRKAGITESAKQFATTNESKHGLTSKALEQASIKDIHDLGRGAVVTKYQQKVNGIEVSNRHFNVIMNQNMELIATSGYFSNAKVPSQSLDNQFNITPDQAISKAFTDIGGDSITLNKTGEKAQYQSFEATGSDKFTFSDQPRVKRIYYPTVDALIPAYYVELMVAATDSKQVQGYGHIISAEDGLLLRRTNLTHSEAFTYNVFASDMAPYTPYDSPFGNDLSPHPTGVYSDIVPEVQVDMNLVTIENSGLISTNDPWLPQGATVTTGNNVDAYADLVQPDGYQAPTVDDGGNEVPGDLRANVTNSDTFDYQYTHGEAYTNVENINAAVVNLFYVTNYMHDLYYDHGFNEAAGTAQTSNYGRGGIEGDAMHAQAQDRSGINNANMTTPSDGGSPKMQMYLWSASKSTMSVSGIDNVTHQLTSGFGNSEADLVDVEIVRMINDTDTTTDGCETGENPEAVAGKMAMVDRGGCDFTIKAINAQSAGAIGVIVVNNTPENPHYVINMGGSDDNITIPAVMVSYRSGSDIDAQLAIGTVTTTIKSSVEYRDGSVDNPIIEHEWGHYFSNRLTSGGLYANSQGQAMGEGWGDFIALMTMARKEDKMLTGNDQWQGIYNDGGYSINNGYIDNAYYFGLRRVPYSTDFNVNSFTFKHIEDQVEHPESHPISGGSIYINSEVHAAGEIWAMALWEAYSGLLNRDELTFEQAQSRMMDYMVAGLKMTPFSPTFTEGRDAILAAAIANDIDDYNVMRAAFTKRGMGINAVSPDRNDEGFKPNRIGHIGNAGVVEDFVSVRNELAILNVTLDTNYHSATGAFCDIDGVLDAGETASLSLSVSNVGSKPLASSQAIVSSSADVTFANGGIMTFDAMPNWNDTAMGMIEVTLNSADVNSIIPVTITFVDEGNFITLPDAIETHFNVNYDIEKDATRTMEQFETPLTIFNDWTRDTVGSDGALEWTNVGPDDKRNYGTGSYIWGVDNNVESSSSLVSPSVTVNATGDFSMSFDHWYKFERTKLYDDSGAFISTIHWDAGVIEISIDGGEWIDAITAGGRFTGEGYKGTVLESNPVLGGRSAFVRQIGITSGNLLSETITFPEGLVNGHDVQLRFRIGTDGGARLWGWDIDNVQFSNYSNALFSSIVADSGVCINRSPVVSTSNQNVLERSNGSQSQVTLSADVVDHDGNTLAYTWTQTDGPNVTLNNANAISPTFIVPTLGADASFTFNVAVADNITSSTASISIDVSNVNEAPVITITDTLTVDEGGSQTLSFSYIDMDGDVVSATEKTEPSHGTVTITATNIKYTPEAGFHGRDTFTVTLTDGAGYTVDKTITVKVKNTRSGGSLGFTLLFLTPLIFRFYRK